MSDPNATSESDSGPAGVRDSGAAQNDVHIRHSAVGALHVLGTDHETVLYHGDDVNAKPAVKEEQEDDDSFYQATLDDVKSMFKDLQRRREALEDAPFKGQKLRAMEKEQAILNSLHDHPNTAIRIRFPDRLVLQGLFRTSDTVGSIKTWLRQYLSDPLLEFYLFTAPPKKVLSDDVKLVEEGLVAMAVIYFGSQAMPEDNRVLKPEVYGRISDPEKAFELAKEKLKVRKRENDDNEEIKASTETQLKDHSAQPSTSSNSQPAARRPVDKGKVPKWFKMK